MKFKIDASSFVLCCCCLFPSILQAPKLSAQVPVVDYLGRWLSKTTSLVSDVSKAIEALAEPIINTVKKVQDFTHKAQRVVNIGFKNLQLLKDIVQLKSQINGYYTNSIRIIKRPRDGDQNGVDDLAWLDKWKHLQILLALSKQTSQVFSLFIVFLEDDVFTMDDKNRLHFLKELKTKLYQIKLAMRIEMRRINREIYNFRTLYREANTFEQFFHSN